MSRTKSAQNRKLELAIERRLNDLLKANGDPLPADVLHNGDAAVFARIATRWHGDHAAKVLRAALELVEAGK